MKRIVLLILLITQTSFLFAQREMYVSAKNGLVVRTTPNKNSKRIGKFKYAEKLKIHLKTGKKINIIDHGNVLKGEWYKVSSTGNKSLIGYVFSAYLTNSEIKNTFKFISYNDDSDYFFLNVKDNKDSLFTFIHNTNDIINYLKDDIVEITWKHDTIVMAGDNSITEAVKLLISSKKIKDGSVSRFRKKYKKKLFYTVFNENKYSNSYLDEIYLIVEYYIANTKNRLLNYAIKDQKKITYSLENTIRNKKSYLLIQITSSFEHKTIPLRSLYYDTNENKLYDYDLPNDTLLEIKQ